MRLTWINWESIRNQKYISRNKYDLTTKDWGYGETNTQVRCDFFFKYFLGLVNGYSYDICNEKF